MKIIYPKKTNLNLKELKAIEAQYYYITLTLGSWTQISCISEQLESSLFKGQEMYLKKEMDMFEVLNKTKNNIIVRTTYMPPFSLKQFCLHIPGFDAAKLIKALEFEGFQSIHLVLRR